VYVPIKFLFELYKLYFAFGINEPDTTPFQILSVVLVFSIVTSPVGDINNSVSALPFSNGSNTKA